MLNMPTHIRTEIEALLDWALAKNAPLTADLCRSALAGNHRAWMLVVKALPTHQYKTA